MSDSRSNAVRIELRVPFADKDEAKRLGARWDPRRKVWYAPEDVDAALLQKWRPKLPASNVRSPMYFLASTTRDCWQCRASTRVIAIVLPREHEIYQVDEDPTEDGWQLANDYTILSYIDYLSDSIAVKLCRRWQHYNIDFSQTIQRFYWMNHCECCAAKLGDFDTFGEPGVGFYPLSARAGASIGLEAVLEPFSARCGEYTCGLDWFAAARQGGRPLV